MFNPFDYPLLVLVASLFGLWLSASIGARLRKTRPGGMDGNGSDFTFVVGGALTLLGLIIAFTFSMAVSRYDLRKNYEEQEANAIGTEYVRADLLPTAEAERVRALLRHYLEQRILYYTTRREPQLREINAQTARLQSEMWTAVVTLAHARPPAIASLYVAGMNDVLNAQGYTQAAWWNRIPTAAWVFLIVISIFCNVLVGYVAHGRSAFLFLILPIALSVSLFLIADIDSPRRGIIRLSPQNLQSLAESLRAQ